MTLLYLPRWMEVLIALDHLPPAKRYPQRLYRECPVSASHTKTVLQTLRYHGLISIDQRGRIRWISLTPQGQQLSQQLLQVRWTVASLLPEPCRS
jgi:predicted transcriptional regulator